MKKLITAVLVAFALTPAAALAKGPPPVAHPFASLDSTNSTLVVPVGAPVLIGQGGGCQEQCDVSWTINGVVAHVGSVAAAGSGTLDFTTSFDTPGTYTVVETLTTSKHGAVASSSVASLVLTAS